MLDADYEARMAQAMEMHQLSAELELLEATHTARLVRLHQEMGERRDRSAAIRRAASRRPRKET